MEPPKVFLLLKEYDHDVAHKLQLHSFEESNRTVTFSRRSVPISIPHD